MIIKSIKIAIWVKPNKEKKFDSTSAEDLTKDIVKLIRNKGYIVPEEFCGNNPELFIVME